MFNRRNSLAVLTSGLMIAVGTTGGCHMARGFRSSETTRSRWSQVGLPSVGEEFDDETYVPEREINAPIPRSSSPASRLSPEPELPPLPEPAPPAADLETVPQARWRPARPRRSSSVSSYSNQSTDSSDLPPARVTYEAEGEFAQQPEITPAPVDDQRGQPRLFQPAGSAKSMFDSMKRKWSR